MRTNSSSSNVVTASEWEEVIAPTTIPNDAQKNVSTLHENGPCLVADGTFNPDNTHQYGCHRDPFETCYQWVNEATYGC